MANEQVTKWTSDALGLVPWVLKPLWSPFLEALVPSKRRLLVILFQLHQRP